MGLKAINYLCWWMSCIVQRGSSKRIPTKATDCFSCSQRWGFCVWANTHQKDAKHLWKKFTGTCYFIMSDEKDTEVLDIGVLMFERYVRKIFGGSFLNLEKWLNIQMPLKIERRKYYKIPLWSSKKLGTFTHCHNRHNNRTPSPIDEKSCFMLWSVLLV